MGMNMNEIKDTRWLSLIVLCTGFLLIVVDMTIVNVALPSIQRDLGFSQSGLAWVINGYLIAFGGLLLLAGRIGDLFGRKRVYLIGLGIFVGASVMCGLSVNQPMLIAARFVQGIGGAVSSAVVLAMIVTMFPKPAEQARAFGVFSLVASAGAAVGLLAGGVIVQAVSWHWIFFVNVPIGLLTAIASARLLASDRGLGTDHGADVIGAILVTAGLMVGVYSIVESSVYGLGSLHTIGFGAVYALNWHFRWFDVSGPMLAAHVHMGLAGWLGLTVMGVSYKLTELFALAHGHGRTLTFVNLGLWNLGLLGLSLSLLFRPGSLLVSAFAGLLALSALLHVVDRRAAAPNPAAAEVLG